jgi:hypothetical protein
VTPNLGVPRLFCSSLDPSYVSSPVLLMNLGDLSKNHEQHHAGRRNRADRGRLKHLEGVLPVGWKAMLAFPAQLSSARADPLIAQ